MEVEVVQRTPLSPVQPPRREVPFPFLERLIVGTLGGFVAGILAVECGLPDVKEQPIAIFAVISIPCLALLGGICGVISHNCGWAAVRPMAWAVLFGALLRIDQPTGWILGGALGGAGNCLCRRSVKGIVKAVARGMLLGLIGWWVVIGYFFALLEAVCWVIGG
jgi:hypothetical protein